MTNARILVTGGAGYIGRHLVQLLKQAHEQFIILDNLSTGFNTDLDSKELIVGDIGDKILVNKILTEYNIDTVIHLAASTSVPQSLTNPLHYYQNNSCKMVNLLESCTTAKVKYFIFSSTAAVYGNPTTELINETHACNPTNPYGRSKLISEQILADTAAATALRYVALRYFNVAGASMQGNIGDRRTKLDMLIPATVQAAFGQRATLNVYGTDYPTPDGTAIRDYIHVEDIAAAHINALDYLRAGGTSATLNCGYGCGYSVQEIIQLTEQLTGKHIPTIYCARRSGDCAAVLADVNRIQTELSWIPKYNNIKDILQSAIDWQIKLMQEGK